LYNQRGLRRLYQHRREVLRRCTESDTHANTFSDSDRDSYTDGNCNGDCNCNGDGYGHSEFHSHAESSTDSRTAAIAKRRNSLRSRAKGTRTGVNDSGYSLSVPSAFAAFHFINFSVQRAAADAVL
jgi:hypothetical protein